MKIIEGKLALSGKERVLIINARFNHIITDRLVEGAKDAFIRHGGDEKNLSLLLVPGAFEIPLALEKALSSGKFDAVCCVGAVIRGSTPHFDSLVLRLDFHRILLYPQLRLLLGFCLLRYYLARHLRALRRL